MIRAQPIGLEIAARICWRGPAPCFGDPTAQRLGGRALAGILLQQALLQERVAQGFARGLWHSS
eukprot:12922155-Alexandrium_andersonii.AAC.1